MERREPSGCNFDGGFNTLICEENEQENFPQRPSKQSRIPVSMSYIPPGRYDRLAAVSLVLLASLLLIVDISLGVHYNKPLHPSVTINDTEYTERELSKLQESYKAAINTINATKKQVDSEMRRQTPTNWELEHQTKRRRDYEEQIEKMTQDIAAMTADLPMLSGGCKHCPLGWILMNSVCYYFSFLERDGKKTWQNARKFCQSQDGDLAKIDSTDEQNATVNFLISKLPKQPTTGFWIGLKHSNEEGTWKWLDGQILVEGYWNDGEPNYANDENCAAVYPRENFFKSWGDVRCGATMKWICEKAPTSLTL